MPDTVDITIIGAGVVGLAVASQVAQAGREVYLLEKNEMFGQEQSSRNSGVIHAGILYGIDTLKKKLCLEGKNLLYEICENKGIPYKQCGKIYMAINSSEAERLEGMYRRGVENGVPLKMLSQKEMNQIEPNIRALSAFYSPTSGIVDSYNLMRYFLGVARDNGAQIVFKSEVTGIEKISDGYRIRVNTPSDNNSFTTRIVVNCAGLHSDVIAAMAGIDVEESKYKLHWRKGEYYSVAGGKNKLIKNLIYPVPGGIGPGIHVCFDVDWRLRLGPLFYLVDKIDYRMDDSNKETFIQSSIMQSLPFIEASDLEPETSGVIAMLHTEGEPNRDYIIKHEYNRGLPGFINLVGIESPGLTASPALGRYVSRMVDEII